MLYFGGLFGLLVLALWVFSLVDIVTTAEDEVRHLPKLLWLLLVLLIPLAGSLVWLLAGRPRQISARSDGRFQRDRPDYPEYDHPGRFTAPDPEADERFLRECRRRAEEQRRKTRDDD